MEIKILRHIIRDLRNEIRQKEEILYLQILELKQQSSNDQLNGLLQHITKVIQADSKIIQNRHLLKFQGLSKQAIGTRTTANTQPNSKSKNQNNFINLSKYQCSPLDIKVLNLGAKFAFTGTAKPSKMFAEIENIVDHLPNEAKDNFRHQCISKLKKANSSNIKLTKSEQTYIAQLKKLRNKPDINIIQADKTNQLVLVDHDSYAQKLDEVLAELQVDSLNKDPTKTIYTKVQQLLCNKKIQIPSKIMPVLYPAPPKLFVRIKLHKTNHPFRPIISKCHSPTYNLEKYLANLLKPLISNHPFNTSSATNLISKIKNIKLQPTDKLLSLDVISLYPNIPIEVVHKIIIEKCENHNNLKPFTKFIEIALNIIFKNNYFSANNKLYLQKKGTPMGSPLSNICSETIMQEIENSIIPKTNLKPKVYLRFVDDIFIIWTYTQNSLLKLIAELSKPFPTIQFTLEKEKKKSIAFLDIKIHRTDEGFLWFDTYSKPTSTPTPIPFESKHPINAKKAFFNTHIQHNINCTTFKFSEKHNLKSIINIANKANYPKNFCHKLISKKLHPPPPLNLNIDTKFTPALPFLENFIPIVNFFRKKYNISIPFKAPHTNSKLILKDRDQTKIKAGIYSIPIELNNTHYQYIGKTARDINLRIYEHKKDLLGPYNNTALKSFLLENPSAIPNWQETNILKTPQNRNLLAWEESLAIATSENAINLEPGRRIPECWREHLPQKPYKKRSCKVVKADALMMEDN